MPTLMFLDKDLNPSAGFRTLALQEMIKQGVLFQGIISPCYAHSKEDVDYFVHALNESLTVYEKALENGYQKFLIGEPAKPVFRKFL